MNRNERRRQLKDDEKAVARGLDVVGRNGSEVIALMRVLHERVREAQKICSVRPLMEFLHANVEQAALRVAHVPVACGNGCAYCCNTWVSVIAPEAIHIARALRERKEAVQTALQAALAMSRGKSLPERLAMVVPCPLLEDRSCSVYRVRPLTCRTAASRDAVVCEEVYIKASDEELPVPDSHRHMRLGYSLAVSGALRQAGLHHGAYEFQAALERVLLSPEGEAQWLAGANIFVGLPRDPAGDPFQNRDNRALFEAAFD